jgi:hypothetical protein
MELLIIGAEREIIAALRAGQSSVRVVHSFFHLWSDNESFSSTARAELEERQGDNPAYV